MESNARGRRAVVYYCDEGIKGFNAPDDDPMKSALTCDLILCPKCEAKQRIEYNKLNLEGQSSGVKRSRRQTGVLYKYILSRSKQLDLKFQIDKQLSITGGCSVSYIIEKRTESGAG
jgi:hypothetical protein